MKPKETPKNQAGKGDSPRPVDLTKYGVGYERAFGTRDKDTKGNRRGPSVSD